MDIRKSFTALTDSEIEAFVEAVIKLKANIVNPTAAVNQQYSVYDQFVALHIAVMNFTVQGFVDNTGNLIAFSNAHNNLAFLPWHREFIRRFELALQQEVPGVTLPYWEWEKDAEANSKLFTQKFMGELNPGSGSVSPINGGYFSGDKPNPAPAWWPANFTGFKIHSDLVDMSNNVLLRGDFIDRNPDTRNPLPPSDQRPTPNWPMPVNLLNQVKNLDLTGTGAHKFYHFWMAVEMGAVFLSGSLRRVGPAHNTGHNYIGGHMSTGASPNDPIFWLHHCYIDRLWAHWQDNVNGGFPDEVTDLRGNPNPPGSRPDDEMWPWVGQATGYAPVFGSSPDITYMLPNYSAQPPRKVKDVFDYRAMGYEYA